MEYISVKEAAEKWGITPRWVQVCCKEGYIAGAERLGKSWFIPKNAPKPEKAKGQSQSTTEQQPPKYSQFLPLITASFVPGECEEFIKSLKSPDEQNLAWAEYYYFRGQARNSIPYAQMYLDHEDMIYRMSACMIYGYANFTLGNLEKANEALRRITEVTALAEGDDEYLKSVCRFVLSLEAVALHKTDAQKINLQRQMGKLPKGVRLFGCYIMAHDEYLKGNYERALGIAETALCVADTVHPIAKLYVNIMAAVALISMKRREEALIYFDQAWELAKEDDLLQAFGVHHNMLRGLVEARLKKDEFQKYIKIVDISRRFGKTRVERANPDQSNHLYEELKPIELVIAILASQGWTNKEIANHMEISSNTVKYYISVIFQKLDVSDRKQLKKYINV